MKYEEKVGLLVVMWLSSFGGAKVALGVDAELGTIEPLAVFFSSIIRTTVAWVGIWIVLHYYFW